MALISPETLEDFRSGATTSYMDPHTKGFVLLGTRVPTKGLSGGYDGLRHRAYLFTSVNNGDQWVHGIYGVQHTHTQTFLGGAAAASNNAQARTVTFSTSAPGRIVAVHLWSTS